MTSSTVIAGWRSDCSAGAGDGWHWAGLGELNDYTRTLLGGCSAAAHGLGGLPRKFHELGRGRPGVQAGDLDVLGGGGCGHPTCLGDGFDQP
jgi:hypothetical protein